MHIKFKPHKSCSCMQCRMGRGRGFGPTSIRLNEKKFRQQARRQIRLFKKGLLEAENIEVFPITSPFTD